MQRGTALLLAALAAGVTVLSVAPIAGARPGEPTRTSQQLKRDVLIHADMWARKPKR